MTPDVARCDEAARQALAALLGRYGLVVENVAGDDPIPGSHWGDPEA